MMCPLFSLLLLPLVILQPAQSETSALASPKNSNRYLSSVSQLPPGLQNTKVEYPESRPTFVHFPNDANSLLKKEMIRIQSPLVLDVVTTVTHWKAPLWDLLKALVHRFRNQNQIIYIRAHYYVGNGLTEQGCRMEFVDTDTGITTERAINSDECRRRCTNGGRYCAPELPEGFAQEPKLIVEETLRRLCIDELYHASDLKHWEYLEAFEALQCQQQEDMAECSRTALSQVSHTVWSQVVDCVQLAGGLDQDVMNVRLQEQLDRQQGSYELIDVPMMHIAGSPFQGSWDVSSILESVCQAYHDNYEVTPIACDFCGSCQDVRKCLWNLECDGTPFTVDAFQQGTYLHDGTAAAPTSPLAQTPINNNIGDPKPPEETPPPTWFSITDVPQSTTTASANPNNADAQDSTDATTAEADDDTEEDNPHGFSFFMGGILAGLVVGLAPAVYFFRDEKKTRREISALLAARRQKGPSYRDDLGLSTGTGRITKEEMQNMEDVMLEEGDASPSKVPFALTKIV